MISELGAFTISLKDGAMMSASLPEEPVLRELEAASLRMARGAGAVLRRYPSGGTRVEYKDKGEKDPVTEADRRVEEYLREEISREFPDHAVVAEESAETTGGDDTDFIWVVDPLDGTANFAAGLPLYAVSIGLLYRGVPVVGSLFLPSTFAGDGVYHARTGGGAFVEGNPLKVAFHSLPQSSGLSGLPGSYGRAFSSRGRRRGTLGEMRVTGSIACEMVLVARGVFQYSIFAGSHIWDVAAGVVLIREAGGEVLEWRMGKWRPLQEFVAPPGKSGEGTAQALRRWGTPLLVGNPGVVEHLASRTRPRRRPSRYILRRVRSLWERLKGGQP
ncbi:MAG: Inositol-phosphate phosphatase [Dehalococcoidia bacterium]|nr:Inositol-phosphate phosphatase [Dehalococcoidia bacterium]